MSTLEIRLLGGVHAVRDGQRIGPFPTRWCAGTLGYLAMNRGRPLHRDVLAERLWPDENHPRKALRRALWGLRSLLEPRGVPSGTFITAHRSHIGLVDGPDVVVDVACFEELLSWYTDDGGHRDNAAPLEGAVRLYMGDFMDGFDFEWCDAERQRLRLAFLTALERLMELHMRRDEWRPAIGYGQQILRRDPLREGIHRALMICYWGQGERPLAIRQYLACKEVLKEELSIPPMAATRDLFEAMRSGTLKSPPDLVVREPVGRRHARPQSHVSFLGDPALAKVGVRRH